MGTFACQPVSDLLTNPSVEERLSSRIEVVCPPGAAGDALRDCWGWTGYTDRAGHARLRCGGVTCYVRRLLYEMVAGPVPAGLFLIETCQHRWCINPLHQEPVTRGEILLRRPATVAARNYSKSRCINGHLLDASNTRFYRAGSAIARECSTCRKVRAQRSRESARRAA
jgi:hypothetical protein